MIRNGETVEKRLVVDHSYGDKQTTYAIPTTREEVSFSEYVDYWNQLKQISLKKKKEKEIQEKEEEGFVDVYDFNEDVWDEGSDDDLSDDDIEGLSLSLEDDERVWVKAIGMITGGDVGIMPFYRDDDLDRETVDINSIYKDPAKISLIKIDQHIQRLMTSYEKPKKWNSSKYGFTFKGEEYWINGKDAAQYISQKGFTVNEVLTIKSLKNLIDKKIKNDGDPLGINWFEKDMYTMCVLARRKGEELPTNRMELNEWLFVRSRHLQNVNMDVVLDINFFLSSIYKKLKRGVIMNFTLTLLKDRPQLWEIFRERVKLKQKDLPET
jgi:hypothetical protein